ncbi:MAG: hypothetical protein M5U34_17985 [Chloroflexi bacterium]|nr:hypothetical protein [Chloroflexota bacterium]
MILIDMAQMNEAPGAIRWLPWQETTGISASTHTMPPYMLARYLTAVTTKVALIGLQPRQTDWDTEMSAEMKTAVHEVTDTLTEILKISPDFLTRIVTFPQYYSTRVERTPIGRR